MQIPQQQIRNSYLAEPFSAGGLGIRLQAAGAGSTEDFYVSGCSDISRNLLKQNIVVVKYII